MVKCVVFDLDGTLVDSVPDLTAALNRLMPPRGLAAFDAAAVTGMVGDGVKALLDRAFAARGRVTDDVAMAEFLADYTANAATLTRLYPGVVAALTLLRDAGWRMAVCTNKPQAPARAILETLGIMPFFAALGGGDSFAVRKPDPGHLAATLAAAGGDPARSVMIGDHHNDIHAAHGVGAKAIWAAWGYGRDVDGSDAVASGFPALAGIIAGFGIV